MFFLLFLSLALIFISSANLTSEAIKSLEDLTIDRFISKFNINNFEAITEDFIKLHINELAAELYKTLEDEFVQVTVPSSFRRYKRIIRGIMNVNADSVRKLLVTNGEVSTIINEEWKLISYDLLSIESDNILSDIDEFGINMHYNFYKYKEYINLDEAHLIYKLIDLFKEKDGIQQNIIESVIRLHKLVIEDEIVKVVFLFESDSLASNNLFERISKLSRLLNVNNQLNKLLVGDFDKLFKISKLQVINLSDIYDKYLTDNFIPIYPYKKIISRLKYLLLNNKASVVSDNINNSSIVESVPYIRFDNSEKVRYFNVTLGKFDDSTDETMILGSESSDIKDSPNLFEEGSGIVSNISTENLIDENRFKQYSNGNEFTTFSDKNDYFETYLADVNEDDDLVGDSTNQTNSQSSNLTVRNRRSEFYNSYIKNTTASTLSMMRQDGVITDSDLKCLSSQFMCPVVRYLSESELDELDRYLLISHGDSNIKKAKTSIWEISESLVDNHGGRTRLLMFVSMRISEVYSSIKRLNQAPLMNVGDCPDEEISFYREKQNNVLSALFSLKEFLEADNTWEISLKRKSFIKNFTPLNSKKNYRLFNDMNSVYFDRTKTYSDFVDSQNQKHFLRLRNSFETGELGVVYNDHRTLTYGNSVDLYVGDHKTNISELCTRFIAVVSITKSINSLCVNSYKFGQKVCSMIFEQPIYNLLSNQDYSWLTGIKLVEIVNRLIEIKSLPKELFINQKNALRALNYSFSQKIYNIHQACTQSLISQKSTAIYRQNVSLHNIKPIFKLSCAEFFGISVFLYD